MKVPVHKTQSSFCVTEFVKHSCLPVVAVRTSPLLWGSARPTISRVCKFLCPNVRDTFCGSYVLCVCMYVFAHARASYDMGIVITQ
jgi:hypothetical protein